jgi:hypothetical protein
MIQICSHKWVLAIKLKFKVREKSTSEYEQRDDVKILHLNMPTFTQRLPGEGSNGNLSVAP